MLEHPARQIDFRPYAGQHVIIGCTGEADDAAGTKPDIYYVLGTVDQGQLPDHVKAIIVDDADEGSELLFVVIVNDAGTVDRWMPLVVLDDRGRLVYGLEYMQAIVETGRASQAYTIYGLHLP